MKTVQEFRTLAYEYKRLALLLASVVAFLAWLSLVVPNNAWPLRQALFDTCLKTPSKCDGHSARYRGHDVTINSVEFTVVWQAATYLQADKIRVSFDTNGAVVTVSSREFAQLELIN